jgi:hypothetical protein
MQNLPNSMTMLYITSLLTDVHTILKSVHKLINYLLEIRFILQYLTNVKYLVISWSNLWKY